MTMEGLLEASGVAKRTLYRWWPTKSAVIGDALLSGFLDVPRNDIPRTPDVWADLTTWLERAAAAMRGPYGEVLRTSVAISATDLSLAATLNEQCTIPARSDIIDRLFRAVLDGQVAGTANLEVIADLLLAVIAFAGLTRAGTGQLPAVLQTLRVGIAASGTAQRARSRPGVRSFRCVGPASGRQVPSAMQAHRRCRRSAAFRAPPSRRQPP
jgi:AcrR family transcriptional regulator